MLFVIFPHNMHINTQQTFQKQQQKSPNTEQNTNKNHTELPYKYFIFFWFSQRDERMGIYVVFFFHRDHKNYHCLTLFLVRNVKRFGKNDRGTLPLLSQTSRGLFKCFEIGHLLNEESFIFFTLTRKRLHFLKVQTF